MTESISANQRAFSLKAFRDPSEKKSSSSKNNMNNNALAAKAPSVRDLLRRQSSDDNIMTHDDGNQNQYPAVPNSQSMPYGYGVNTSHQTYNNPYEYRPGTNDNNKSSNNDNVHHIERTVSGGLLMKSATAEHSTNGNVDVDDVDKKTPVPPEFNNPVYGKKTSKGMGHWIKKTTTNLVVDVTASKMTPNQAASKANAMMELQRVKSESGIMVKHHQKRRNLVKQIFGPPAEKTEVKLVKFQRQQVPNLDVSLKAMTFDNGDLQYNQTQSSAADVIPSVARAHTFDNHHHYEQSQTRSPKASSSDMRHIVESQSFDRYDARERAEELLQEKNARKPRRNIVKQLFGSPSEKQSVKLDKLERRILSKDSEDAQHTATLPGPSASSPRRHGVQTLGDANRVSVNSNITYLGASPSYDTVDRHDGQYETPVEQLIQFNYDAPTLKNEQESMMMSPDSVMKPVVGGNSFE